MLGYASKMSKEELMDLIIDSIERLDEDILAKDYNLEYGHIIEIMKTIDDRIRALDTEGCIQLFNRLNEMIEEQKEETGYANPATGAYYEYMFYRVPNTKVKGRTRTHNK